MLNDGIQCVWELQERHPFTVRSFSGSRIRTGVSACHHESPDIQASNLFLSPRFHPHLPPRDYSELHLDQPTGKELASDTPTMIGRKFKALGSAQDTPYSSQQIPKTLLLTTLTSVMWQVKDPAWLAAGPSHFPPCSPEERVTRGGGRWEGIKQPLNVGFKD